MAPCNQSTSRATSSAIIDNADSKTIMLTDAQEALQATQAKIKRLQAQLGAWNIATQPPLRLELVTVLEAIA